MKSGSSAIDMLGRSKLISVGEARDILTRELANRQLQTKKVSLLNGLGGVLAESIYSPEDLPSHARSTMDGYAVRATDTFGASESMPAYLEVTGEILMGEMPQTEVAKGCCHKIPTGGLLPPGADSVVMLEHTIGVDDTMVEVVKGVGVGTNLIQKGDDIAQGGLAFSQGHRLRPQDIGLLAGLGIDEVVIVKPLRVGILSTGDEIIDYRQKPQPGQIRNINTPALGAMVRSLGHDYIDYGIVSDAKEHFLNLLQKAIEQTDLVLFSGGSSVGIRDLGEQVIEELGPPGVLVHGVTLKPGKPILIGMSGTTPLFGLPGHPASAMVCFDLFVRPAMRSLEGQKVEENYPGASVRARINQNLNSAPGRRDVIRVQLKKEQGQTVAEPVFGKSGAISTLSRADGFFFIEEDSQGISENSEVEVFLYQ